MDVGCIDIKIPNQLALVNSCVCCRKSKFRSCEAVVGAVNHVFRATDEDFEMVEIGRKMYFQSRRKLRYWQCEYRAAKWEVTKTHTFYQLRNGHYLSYLHFR